MYLKARGSYARRPLDWDRPIQTSNVIERNKSSNQRRLGTKTLEVKRIPEKRHNSLTISENSLQSISRLASVQERHQRLADRPVIGCSIDQRRKLYDKKCKRAADSKFLKLRETKPDSDKRDRRGKGIANQKNDVERENSSGSRESEDVPDIEIQSPFRRSLFQNVAPYISFEFFDGPDANLPPEIAKHLLFQCGNRVASVVKQTLEKSGFTICGDEEWCGTWGMKKQIWQILGQLKYYQKVNTFPGTSQMGRKDYLWLNVNRMILKFGIEHFGFVPTSFIMPEDFQKFRKCFVDGKDIRWIIKPPMSDRGEGIKVVHDWHEIPYNRPVVVQEYVTKPKLINGVKFHLRLYVLISSFDPLKLYLYKDGLAKFATVKYQCDARHMKNKFMHLTNYSINKENKCYKACEDINACVGHKWSLKCLLRYLEDEHIETATLWDNIKDIVIKTVISAAPAISEILRSHTPSRYTFFELLGFDILIDEKIKPWLLEVNTGPTMVTDSLLDYAVKGPLIRNILNIVGYHIPPTLTEEEMKGVKNKYPFEPLCQDLRLHQLILSPDEIEKQGFWVQVSHYDENHKGILGDLKPDDVRILIQYEDELTQLDRFEVIFPTADTHNYLKYFGEQSYYNLLLSAWEETHAEDRKKGIDRLRRLCRNRYHLTVPNVGRERTNANGTDGCENMQKEVFTQQVQRGFLSSNETVIRERIDKFVTNPGGTADSTET